MLAIDPTLLHSHADTGACVVGPGTAEIALNCASTESSALCCLASLLVASCAGACEGAPGCWCRGCGHLSRPLLGPRAVREAEGQGPGTEFPWQRTKKPHRWAFRRIILTSLGIRHSLPPKGLYGGAGTLGFLTPLLYDRSKLRYIKGIYGCINRRSAFPRGMILYTDLPRPMQGDWDSAREWLHEYGLQIVPVASPLLSPTPVETTVLLQVQGPVIVVTDTSQEAQADGWAVVLIDSVGIVASAHSGALFWCRSSWAAEWCAKGLALWLLQTLDIAPKDVCGIIALNLAASSGTTSGSPSHCVWLDPICRHYASYLADGPIKEFYGPAQDDTQRLDLVAGWRAEADQLAKAGLRLAGARVIPLPSLLADLNLLYCNGSLVCNVVSPLHALYTQTCQARASSPEGYDTACWEQYLLSSLLPNRAQKFVCWPRMAPHTHVFPNAELHCYLWRAPVTLGASICTETACPQRLHVCMA